LLAAVMSCKHSAIPTACLLYLQIELELKMHTVYY